MEKLHTYLKRFDRLAVAVSGGADSACLLREAAATLGTSRVLAVTVQTECLPQRRLRMAKRIAALADVEHVVIPLTTLEDEQIRINSLLRRYFCRRKVLQAVLDEAWMRGCEHVADGTHTDDMADDPPESAVAGELGVYSPFVACGMGRWQVAALRGGMAEDAAQIDGCLADRLPAGTPLTLDAFERIDEAEEALLAMGFVTARVYAAGDRARIVVSEREMQAVIGKWPLAEEKIRQAGFAAAVIDQEI